MSSTSDSGRHLRKVCVYCGSAPGVDPAYEAAAALLGSQLAAAGLGLVYGGGGNGLMGTLARAVLAGGGEVTGIIPDFMAQAAPPLPGMASINVPDMHARKRLMFEHADAFVALPGGIGTLEELVEQLTWVQLQRHMKPVLLADIGGFWRPLLALFAHMRAHRFIQPSFEVRYLVAEKIEDVVPMLETAAAKNLSFEAKPLDPHL